MATVTYSLLRPYKKSESKDKEQAAAENKKFKEELKKRRQQGKSIDSLLVNQKVRIYLHLTLDRQHVISVKTDEKILPKMWDFKKGRVKSSYSGSPEINRILDNLSNNVEDYYRELKLKYPDISFDQVDKLVKEYVLQGSRPDTGKKSFYQVYEEYINSRVGVVNQRTVQRYRTLLLTLKDFQSKTGTQVDFDNIDLKFHDRFVSYLLAVPNPKKPGVNGLTNDTISKHVSSLKHFLKWSLEREYHSNNAFMRSEFGVSRKPKRDIVTLQSHELAKLAHHDFSKNKRLERVRDLFLFATYTGQRWSDVVNFNKRQIVGQYWQFDSHKTRKKTRIPLIGFASPARDILLKYDFQLPVISSQNFNDYIKEVGKITELNRPVYIKRYSGNKLIEISKPLHEFMSSHMARRTCVTLLLERGIAPTTIMKITGHTDLRTLMKYENTGEDALIKALEEASDINQAGLKVV